MSVRQFIFRYPVATAATVIGLSGPILAVTSFALKEDNTRAAIPKGYPLPAQRISGLDKYGDE